MRLIVSILVLNFITASNSFANIKDSYVLGNETYKSGMSKLSFCKKLHDSKNFFASPACSYKSKYFNNGLEISSIKADGMEKFIIFNKVSSPIKNCVYKCYEFRKIGDGKFYAVANSAQEAQQIVNNLNNPGKKSSDNSQGITFNIKQKKEQCKAIGFKPETEKFADCVLRLVELDVKTQQQNQIAQAQNSGNDALAKQLQKQNYDRGTDVLLNLGQQLLKPKQYNSNIYMPKTQRCTIQGFGSFAKMVCR
tara:strand:- start:2 stop:754 length:753 start_codon:yes stop_codon:yes gene_type:complete